MKPNNAVLTVFLRALVLGFAFGLVFVFFARENEPMFITPSPFFYPFSSTGTLYEAGSSLQSTSPYYWLNSGGKLIIGNGNGATVSGDLTSNDTWRLLYSVSNPVDTDNGYHPQNLFRLITKSTWDNVSTEAGFFISADHLSTSPNRNQSNGLLLMSRYQAAGQTLYYAGIRVDGTAVLKKKIQQSPGAFGTYYTMAQKQIFPGTYSITPQTGASQNLLPHNEWVSLKMTTITNEPSKTVTVSLYMKRANETTWTLLLSSTDTGKNFGNTAPIYGPGAMGLRTDFMDVKFDNYRIENL